MALKSTIFKVELQVADMDRPHYAAYSLTIARHPSETDERMMARLLGFSLLAHEWLAFGKGLSSDDEPDLWQKDLTGAIELWGEVGLPDERRLRKAAGRAKQVWVLTYGGRVAEIWWNQNRSALAKLSNLTVLTIPPEASQALAALANRNMAVNCTVQEGQIWFACGNDSVHLEPEVLQQAKG